MLEATANSGQAKTFEINPRVEEHPVVFQAVPRYIKQWKEEKTENNSVHDTHQHFQRWLFYSKTCDFIWRRNSFFIWLSGSLLDMAHVPLIFNFMKAQRLEKNVWAVPDKNSCSTWVNEGMRRRYRPPLMPLLGGQTWELNPQHCFLAKRCS